jgi:dihydrolipoamide dehydrogenase
MIQHDLVIIGAGPGGYVAAIRAAQLGLNVACVEKEQQLGGTCLRVGCIPSKALLESSEKYTEAKHTLSDHGIRVAGVELDLPAMMARKDRVVKTLTGGVDSLFKKNKITRYLGTAKLSGPGRVDVSLATGGVEQLQAKNIIIATGSRSSELKGVVLDGKNVTTSTEALAYDSVPKHLIVIGGGYIGVELGCVWARLGSKVTVLEYLDRILAGADSDIAAEALKILTKQGIEFKLNTRVTSARATATGCVVERDGAEPITCDKVLVAVGRKPNSDNLGLETVGVELDKLGRIVVDKHLKTTAANIYAIGDVVPGFLLAHKAEDEGIAVAEFIATGHGHVNYDAIPAVVYTEPEIASVGRTEDTLKQQGVAYKKGVFQFRANGRARAMNHVDGFVKILADAATDRVLGVHIIGARAGDIIAECAAAIEFGASAEDIARTSHAHPTLAEAVKEAALAVDSRVIHS